MGEGGPKAQISSSSKINKLQYGDYSSQYYYILCYKRIDLRSTHHKKKKSEVITVN